MSTPSITGGRGYYETWVGNWQTPPPSMEGALNFVVGVGAKNIYFSNRCSSLGLDCSREPKAI
jgi:hypothetical protein